MNPGSNRSKMKIRKAVDMADLILTVNGIAQAYYADTAAWHGKGTVGKVLTGAQLIKAVPIWRKPIEMVPVAIRVGGRWVEQADYRATIRAGDTVAQGIVSPEYERLSDQDAVETMESVVTVVRERRVLAGFVAGVALENRWNTASIDLSRAWDTRIKRDPSKQETHLIGQWKHDGSGGLTVAPWNRRVECNNMRGMWIREAESKGLIVTIRHTGDMSVKVRDAQRVLGLMEDIVKADTETMDALNEAHLPGNGKLQKWLDSFLVELIPIPQEMDRPIFRERARAEIAGLFRSSRNLAGIPQSPYRVLQAVTEYADHHRPMRGAQENIATGLLRQVRSIIPGPTVSLKEHAMELLRAEFLAPITVASRN